MKKLLILFIGLVTLSGLHGMKRGRSEEGSQSAENSGQSSEKRQRTEVEEGKLAIPGTRSCEPNFI